MFNLIAQTLNYSAGAVEVAVSGSYDDQVGQMDTMFQKALSDVANSRAFRSIVGFLKPLDG